MARKSSIITISLPPALETLSSRVAEKQHMTRSELLRTALRQYLELQATRAAIRVYETERAAGTLKELKTSLSRLAK